MIQARKVILYLNGRLVATFDKVATNFHTLEQHFKAAGYIFDQIEVQNYSVQNEERRTSYQLEALIPRPETQGRILEWKVMETDIPTLERAQTIRDGIPLVGNGILEFRIMKKYLRLELVQCA